MTSRKPGSLFQRLREAEKRDPGNEVETVEGRLNAVPYNDRNFLVILYFKSQTQIKTVYTEEITREGT